MFDVMLSCYRHPGDNSVSNLGRKMAFLEAAHYKKPWQNVSLSPGEQVALLFLLLAHCTREVERRGCTGLQQL